MTSAKDDRATLEEGHPKTGAEEPAPPMHAGDTPDESIKGGAAPAIFTTTTDPPPPE